jgi:hypothetical protein
MWSVGRCCLPRQQPTIRRRRMRNVAIWRTHSLIVVDDLIPSSVLCPGEQAVCRGVVHGQSVSRPTKWFPSSSQTRSAPLIVWARDGLPGSSPWQLRLLYHTFLRLAPTQPQMPQEDLGSS